MLIVRNSATVIIMPPVNPIRVPVNATKAILEKSAKINVLQDFMVPVV